MSALAKIKSQVESTTKPTSKPAPVFNGVKLNRNFLNYPLAQDPRKRAKWGRDNYGDWTAPLPSDKRIQITLHKDILSELVRCPSALDMNVLFQILAEAQHTHSSKVTFPSFADLARRVGLTARDTNRKRIENSLLYLLELRLDYSCWRDPVKKEQVDRAFQPPLKEFKQTKHSNKIEVRLNQEWLRLTSKGYYRPVPLPLSGEAITQNLCLLRLASISNDSRSEEFTYKQGKRGLTRKLGLNHATRNHVFAHSSVRAEAWFAAHQGQLDTWDGPGLGGKVVFFFKTPKVPRKNGPSSKPKPDPQANISGSLSGVKPDPQANPLKKERVYRTVRYEAADGAAEAGCAPGGLDEPEEIVALRPRKELERLPHEPFQWVSGPLCDPDAEIVGSDDEDLGYA